MVSIFFLQKSGKEKSLFSSAVGAGQLKKESTAAGDRSFASFLEVRMASLCCPPSLRRNSGLGVVPRRSGSKQRRFPRIFWSRLFRRRKNRVAATFFFSPGSKREKESMRHSAHRKSFRERDCGRV